MFASGNRAMRRAMANVRSSVGIGFSGTYDGEGAECEATALAGKRSIRFRAVLRKLVAA